MRIDNEILPKNLSTVSKILNGGYYSVISIIGIKRKIANIV